MENISSEQELKQLLEEGRITEEEYQELLEAIRKQETMQKPLEVLSEPVGSKTRTGYGKTALMLMIIGAVIPIAFLAVHFAIGIFAGARLAMFLFVPFILVGIVFEFLAFIFGIIGWKSPQGKIAAIGVPCMGLVIIPGFLVLFLFNVRTAAHRAAEEEALALAYEQAAITEVRARHLENHKTFPMDTLEGLISQDMAEIDEDIYVNGGGSLKIVSDSSEKRTIRLYEIPPWDLEGSILNYQAKLKSLNLKGKAYLEMWCDIPGKGKFFSRGLEQPISGTTDWTKTNIPFRLEPDQKPANIKLNLVVEGPGTIWIDDITLSSNPL